MGILNSPWGRGGGFLQSPDNFTKVHVLASDSGPNYIIIIIIIIIIITISDIPGNHDVKELQKTAILSTAHLLPKVLT